MKRCSKCHEDKPRVDFYAHKAWKDGFHPWCRSCAALYAKRRREANPEKYKKKSRAYYKKNRERLIAANTKFLRDHPKRKSVYGRRYRLKKEYGLTEAEYTAMFVAQGGCCANEACRQAAIPGRSMDVDHDHETGLPRALLCNGCNSALGRVKDDPARLRGLVEYIEKHNKLREERAAASNLIQFPAAGGTMDA